MRSEILVFLSRFAFCVASLNLFEYFIWRLLGGNYGLLTIIIATFVALPMSACVLFLEWISQRPRIIGRVRSGNLRRVIRALAAILGFCVIWVPFVLGLVYFPFWLGIVSSGFLFIGLFVLSWYVGEVDRGNRQS